MYLLKCWFCDVAFNASHANTHYCSQKCKLHVRRARGRRYAYFHSEQIKEQHRKYRENPENRQKMRNRANEYHKKADKLKLRARWAVRHAIESGRLVSQPCIKCGKKAQAHHDNYRKPLDVIWVCPAHHKEIHDKKEGL